MNSDLWTPLEGSASTGRTHSIKHESDDCVVLQPTTMHKSFGYIVSITGILALITGLILLIVAKNVELKLVGAILLASGFFPAKVGFVFASQGKKGIAIDKGRGEVWEFTAKKGEKSTDTSGVTLTKFSEVCALQLLTFLHWKPRTKRNLNRSSNSTSADFAKYQFNLVLAGGERVNLTTQGSKPAAMQDAKRLADFLDLPLWIKPGDEGQPASSEEEQALPSVSANDSARE